jgi:hypothetical protein
MGLTSAAAKLFLPKTWPMLLVTVCFVTGSAVITLKHFDQERGINEPNGFTQTVHPHRFVSRKAV